MLGPGRYLLGVLELVLLVGPAWLGASQVRARLLPKFEGAPAHLATSVLALAVLLWVAEILGTVSLFKPVPYLVVVVVVGLGLWWLLRRPPEGGLPHPYLQVRVRETTHRRDGLQQQGLAATVVALAIALIAVIHFAGGVKTRLSTGMTGFDSTWYHGPFAAGFFQSANTIDLHFIAPQFLAWFYPANGEIFHAIGMLAFGRDVLSPLLNLGWFAGCLGACWCIGRPYRVAPWSLALGAIALSVPVLGDQAGEARNDIVGIFFLLAAVAIALNAWAEDGKEAGRREGLEWSALVITGLAAGLAAGTKLNFLLPAAVLVLGLALVPPPGSRWKALWISAVAALAGGGYWYLRNLIHTGNPLPWVHHLGPISLPAPEQALGGREAHSVVGYLTDASVWSDWFVPGLHQAFWFLWPLLGLAALTGLVLSLVPSRRRADLSSPGRQIGPSAGMVRWVLPLVGLVGLATAVAWLVAPTSASGPDGMPRGFESGLRYLAPALILGLALLPASPPLRSILTRLGSRSSFPSHSGGNDDRARTDGSRYWVLMMGLVLVVIAVVAGYPIQRHYLQSRYENPSFTTPGLNATFAWARGVSDARIATTSTRQYPLFGTDLTNHVQFVGTEAPHGGFEAPTSCRAYREELNAGHYNYVVTSKDRTEPGKPPYPDTTRWTESPQAEVILKKPPTVVFKLSGPLDPMSCAS